MPCIARLAELWENERCRQVGTGRRLDGASKGLPERAVEPMVTGMVWTPVVVARAGNGNGGTGGHGPGRDQADFGVADEVVPAEVSFTPPPGRRGPDAERASCPGRAAGPVSRDDKARTVERFCSSEA